MSFSILYLLVSVVIVAAAFGLGLWLRGFKAAILSSLVALILMALGFVALVSLITRNM